MEEEKLKKVIMERELKPCHLLFAFYSGGLGEKRIISQGAMNIIAEFVAPRLFKALCIMGLIKEKYSNNFEGFKEFVKDLNSAIEINKKDLEVVRMEGNKVEVHITSALCKFCPKGVGGAEIPGTLCIFPCLIEALANLAGIKCKLEYVNEKVLRKEEGFCKITYTLG